MEIAGKSALVLGGTRGIGKAIALSLAAQGATIVLPYFDWPKDIEKTIAELKNYNAPHLFIKADLRNPQKVKELFGEINCRHNKLDILINNIERGGMPIVHGPYTDEQWEIEIETTLKAKWLVFQAALPLLKKSGQGVVINFSSIAAHTGRSGVAGLIFNDCYAAANRAISLFTETWAREGAPDVRVNEIVLGFVESRHAEGTRGWSLLTAEQQEAIHNHTLLKRSGTIKEVVDAVMFIIQKATFMTGTSLKIDGGYTLAGEAVPPIPAGVGNLEVIESQEEDK